MRAAGILHRVCDAADAFGRRGRDGQNSLRLTLGLVDLLLPARFGVLDRLLLGAFCVVNQRVAERLPALTAERVRRDPDLESLRGDPRFAAIAALQNAR